MQIDYCFLSNNRFVIIYSHSPGFLLRPMLQRILDLLKEVVEEVVLHYLCLDCWALPLLGESDKREGWGKMIMSDSERESVCGMQ